VTLLGFVGLAVAGALGMYYGVGGWFEWRYYVRRRETAHEWKIQPRRGASARVRRRDLALGTGNLVVASVASGALAHAVATTNPTAVYMSGETHGVAFSVATALAYFLLTDAGLYWAHRGFHRPALFRAVHRLHHRNTTPSAFTSAAAHPIEFFSYQAIMLAPLFFLPVHAAGVIAVLVYQNFVALLDHSGVNLGSLLPWQPPPRFHDDHHVHFHVNYGQTLGVWDWAFGTWRREGRVYGEHVFGGRGRPDLDARGEARRVRYR
jgi:Delta7-sterol 5-desaturase